MPNLKNNAQLINQSSGEIEYYSEPKLVEAARQVMGSIDLDPASSESANKIVKAAEFFTIERDGMLAEWTARTIWLNWPFGRFEEACAPSCTKDLDNPKHRHHDFALYGNKAWVDKLQREHDSGSFDEACVLCYASTSEAWFQPLLDFPQCFLSPRTNYYLPDGTIKKGVTKGSVVTYLGSNLELFAATFQKFGKIKIRY